MAPPKKLSPQRSKTLLGVDTPRGAEKRPASPPPQRSSKPPPTNPPKEEPFRKDRPPIEIPADPDKGTRKKQDGS
jgi:hypothetical protein